MSRPTDERVLLLDVMGTLVHEPFYEDMPAWFGLTFEELLEQKHPTAWRDFELGTIDEPALLRTFFRDGREVDGVALERHMRASYRLLDGVEPLLADLRDAGVEMHALSNYAPWYRWIEEETGLSRFLTWSFVSCDIGVRKPDPDAWRIPMRALDRAAAELVFVDDREQNCAAARALGVDAVRFTSADRLREDLVERGLL